MNIDELNLTDETKAAVEKLIQSETDKVRTKYVGELKTVQEELAKYKPAEKTEAEINLEARIADLEARENALQSREKLQDVVDTLAGEGLPTDLVKYIRSDVDITSLVKDLNQYRINNSFRPSGHGANEGLSKEDFKGMNYMERMKLYQESPDLYKSLTE